MKSNKLHLVEGANYTNPLPCKRCGGIGEVLPLAEWKSWVGRDYYHPDPRTCAAIMANVLVEPQSE